MIKPGPDTVRTYKKTVVRQCDGILTEENELCGWKGYSQTDCIRLDDFEDKLLPLAICAQILMSF